jgi:hypothetical protein
MSDFPNDIAGARLIYSLPLRTSDSAGAQRIYLCISGALELRPSSSGNDEVWAIPDDVSTLPPLRLEQGVVHRLERCPNPEWTVFLLHSHELPESYFDDADLLVYNDSMGPLCGTHITGRDIRWHLRDLLREEYPTYDQPRSA